MHNFVNAVLKTVFVYLLLQLILTRFFMCSERCKDFAVSIGDWRVFGNKMYLPIVTSVFQNLLFKMSHCHAFNLFVFLFLHSIFLLWKVPMILRKMYYDLKLLYKIKYLFMSSMRRKMMYDESACIYT